MQVHAGEYRQSFLSYPISIMSLPQQLSHVLSASDLASMVAEEATPARSSKAAASEIGDTPSARLPESPIEEVRRVRHHIYLDRCREHCHLLGSVNRLPCAGVSPPSHCTLAYVPVQIAEGSINESASIEFAEDIESAQV